MPDLFICRLVINTDGSLSGAEADYAKTSDGSYVLTNTSSWLTSYSGAYMHDRAAQLGGSVNIGDVAFFTRFPSGVWLNLEDMIALRMAVEKGITTSEKVIAALGDISVTGSSPSNFHYPFPSTISAAEYAASGGNVAPKELTVREVFTKAVPFVDNSNVAQSNQPCRSPLVAP